MTAIAKKEISIKDRLFTVRINVIQPVENGHYVEVWWSVHHEKHQEETSFKLMSGDKLLTAAKYDFETGKLKKVVLARNLLSILRAVAVDRSDFYEFNFFDTGLGSGGETLGDISDSINIDLT